MSKNRYEREIEEILSKMEPDAPPKERPPREERPPISSYRPSSPRQPAPRPTFSWPNWKRLSAGQYIAAAFGVALLATFVGTFSKSLASFMVILAVVLFLVPILLYNTTGTTTGGWSTREEKRWRGQVIDFETRRNVTNDPFAGIKRWFRRR
jgi:hypothetical protein